MNAWLDTLIAAVRDEISRLVRNPSILLVLVGIPVVYPILTSWLYQRNAPVERPTVVVDHDGSSLSRKLQQSLDATQGIAIETRVEDVDRGFEMLRERRAEVLLFVPADFSNRLRQGEQATVKIWINSANMLTYGTAAGATRETIAEMNEELGRAFFHQQGLTTTLAERRVMPIRVDSRHLFFPTVAYGEFFITGVFLIAFQQLMLISLPFSVGMMREEGEGLPLRFPFTSLAGRMAVHAFFYLLASLFIVLGVTPWFGWGLTSAWSVLVLFGVFGLAMLPLSMIAASLVRSRYSAFQVLMFASTPLFLVSGFTWPFDQMPRWLQAFASIFPATPALRALRVLAAKTPDLRAISGELSLLLVLFAVNTALALAVTRLAAWRARCQAATVPASDASRRTQSPC